jgi:hypothetical protein
LKSNQTLRRQNEKIGAEREKQAEHDMGIERNQYKRFGKILPRNASRHRHMELPGEDDVTSRRKITSQSFTCGDGASCLIGIAWRRRTTTLHPPSNHPLLCSITYPVRSYDLSGCLSFILSPTLLLQAFIVLRRLEGKNALGAASTPRLPRGGAGLSDRIATLNPPGLVLA